MCVNHNRHSFVNREVAKYNIIRYKYSHLFNQPSVIPNISGDLICPKSSTNKFRKYLHKIIRL